MQSDLLELLHIGQQAEITYLLGPGVGCNRERRAFLVEKIPGPGSEA